MEIARIQSELKSIDVTYKGYELLEYLKKTFFSNLIGADIQRLRPLAFREARDVKQAFDELVNADLISANYDKGNIFDIVPNIEKLILIQDISKGITITKKTATKKRSTKSDIPDDVKDILLHYNSHASLPRPSTPTPLVVQRITDKLAVYSPEQIKDALDLAANAKWLINKGSEVWCNCAWLMNVIEEFMNGGKYFKGSGATTDTTDKYKLDDDNSEVFW